MYKKISTLLVATFIAVILTSGCSSVPNGSSEVGNPNPSEDAVINPYNSVDLNDDLALKFDASLTLENIEAGSFELTEDDLVVASLQVSKVDEVTRNTISSCEEDAMNWTGFDTCFIDETLYAVAKNVDEMVTFEFFADDIEMKIRLISIKWHTLPNTDDITKRMVKKEDAPIGKITIQPSFSINTPDVPRVEMAPELTTICGALGCAPIDSQ